MINITLRWCCGHSKTHAAASCAHRFINSLLINSLLSGGTGRLSHRLVRNRGSKTACPVRSSVACRGSTATTDSQRRPWPTRGWVAEILLSRCQVQRAITERSAGPATVLSPPTRPSFRSCCHPVPAGRQSWRISCVPRKLAGSVSAFALRAQISAAKVNR